MNNSYSLSIDIGGTKTQYGLFNNKFDLLNKKKEFVKCTGNVLEDFLNIVNNLRSFIVESSIKISNIKCIGVNVPAKIDYKTNTIIWAPNLINWRNFNVGCFFKKEIGIPTFLSFDGHAAALGEYHMCYKKEVRNMIYISIGTGLGAGLILNGKLFLGSNNLAGAIGWFITDIAEVGKNAVPFVGWLESKVSGKYLHRLVNKSFLNNAIKDSRILPTELLKFYKKKKIDSQTNYAIKEMLDYLGVAISNIVSLLDLDLVVIGGGVGSSMDFALDYLVKIVTNNSQGYIGKDLKIRLSRLENAPLFGASISAIERAKK